MQSDRLPKKNSLEGLLLLQQAWGERDICNFLADRYKLYTKTLYVAQLICSWLVVLFTQLSFSSSFLGPSDSVFLMSILSGAVVSLEGILRPKPKWHALRKGTFSLESLIWCLLANIFIFVQLLRILNFAQQSFKHLICHHDGINPCSGSRIDHWYSRHVRIGPFACPTFLREWTTVKRIASEILACDFRSIRKSVLGCSRSNFLDEGTISGTSPSTPPFALFSYMRKVTGVPEVIELVWVHSNLELERSRSTLRQCFVNC